MKTVKIETHEVGQKFACAACVKAANNKIIHTTDDYPYGMRHNAYLAAREWAESNGYRVADADEE